MSESVAFKTYLKRDGHDVEVRRFGIDSGAASNLMYLRSKIQAMFPSIENDKFTVFWQDNDKDYIAIGSDEELLEALTSGISQPFKLFVNITTEQQSDQGVPGQPKVHPGILCDACDQAVVGFRYKCVTCPDFDLCASCEGAGKHPDHFMLRMPFPLGANSCHPKFFRKFFGRPHKFHKFARHHPQAGGRCPFSPRQGSAPGQQGLAPGETDMFNFSALMDFMTSMTGASAGQANEPDVNAQTSATAQASPGQQTGSPGPTPPRQTVAGAEYLQGIGQAITAFLDPFGVNVTFDVRNPTSCTQETPAASQQTPTTTEPAASADTNVHTPSQRYIPAAAQQNVPTTVQHSVPAAVQHSVPAAVQQKVPAAVQHSVPAAAQQNVPSTSQPLGIYPSLILRESSPTTENRSTPVRDTTPLVARRNSDDWTVISRVSPTRSEVAMDVDESRFAKSSGAETIIGAAAPITSPAPLPSAPLADPERQRMQEAINNIRSMGFNYESQLLRDLLRQENGDVASVLETILNINSSKN